LRCSRLIGCCWWWNNSRWGAERHAGRLCDIELGMKLVRSIGDAMRPSRPSPTYVTVSLTTVSCTTHVCICIYGMPSQCNVLSSRPDSIHLDRNYRVRDRNNRTVGKNKSHHSSRSRVPDFQQVLRRGGLDRGRHQGCIYRRHEAREEGVGKVASK